MFKSKKLTAQEQFAATQKKDMKAREEKEQAKQEVTEHRSKLRALRLAKEAADKEAAELAAAEKLATKSKKTKRPAQAH